MTAAPAEPVPAATADETRPWPAGAIFRDIVRGGLAALVVGIVVGGIGSRLAMRAIALVVPEATGLTTEGGNVIGAITVQGTMFLVIFAGMFSTLALATLWVAISPWLPKRTLWRALAGIPIALALGTAAMVQADNIDFVILGYDPLVLAILLAVVAATAPAMAVMDAWLDRRLPRGDTIPSVPGTLYGVIGVFGVAIGVLAAVGLLASPELRPAGVTVVGVGLATVAWWALRLRGATEPPRSLLLAGRGLLIAGPVIGLVAAAPELMGAVGIR